MKLFERIQKCEGPGEAFLRIESFGNRGRSLGLKGVFDDGGGGFVDDLLLFLDFELLGELGEGLEGEIDSFGF